MTKLNVIFNFVLLATLLIGLPFIPTNNVSAEATAYQNISPTVEQNINIAKTSGKHIKVALLLDTSNSMDGLIDQAKAQLWDIVNELSLAKHENERPSLAIALYEYGNDNLAVETGYIRQILPFSSDLDEISAQLFSLSTRGGSEYCGQVIQASLQKLDWGNEAADLKLIFIAGNEIFTQGPVHYNTAAALANEKDVTINTIFCGNYEKGIALYWKQISDITRGDYMSIEQNKASVHIDSPYDSKILACNQRLNLTYIPYGSAGFEKIQNQKTQDSNANIYGSANAVKRTISKSSHFYKNTTWDLVDAEESKGFSYEKLKKEELPVDLQGKTTAEIKILVAAKRIERKAIQAEIQSLNAKRKLFVAEQKKLNSTINGLEDVMMKAIKKQAARKQYQW